MSEAVQKLAYVDDRVNGRGFTLFRNDGETDWHVTEKATEQELHDHLEKFYKKVGEITDYGLYTPRLDAYKCADTHPLDRPLKCGDDLEIGDRVVISSQWWEVTHHSHEQSVNLTNQHQDIFLPRQYMPEIVELHQKAKDRVDLENE